MLVIAAGLWAVWAAGPVLDDPWGGRDPFDQPPDDHVEWVIVGNSIAAADLVAADLPGARQATLQGSQLAHWLALARTRLQHAPWDQVGVLLCAPLQSLRTGPLQDPSDILLLEALLGTAAPDLLAQAGGGDARFTRLHRGRRRIRDALLTMVFALGPRALGELETLQRIRVDAPPLPHDPTTQVRLPSVAGFGRSGGPEDREPQRTDIDHSFLPDLVGQLGRQRLVVVLPPTAPGSGQPCQHTPRDAAVLGWLQSHGVRVIDGSGFPISGDQFATRHHIKPAAAKRFTAAVGAALHDTPMPGCPQPGATRGSSG